MDWFWMLADFGEFSINYCLGVWNFCMLGTDMGEFEIYGSNDLFKYEKLHAWAENL
jgi:hypothetical protein